MRESYDILSDGASELFMDRPFWCKLFALVTDKYKIRWTLASD